MATVDITSPVMTEEAGQAIAAAIGTMSATSVGNLSALTTTDKTSLVGAINELKSGLNNVPKFATVNITIPSTVSAVSDLVPLPSGFTKSNTVVVSAYCDPNTATRYYNDVMTVEGVQIFLTNNNVQVSTTASAISGWLGKTITVLLASI